MPRMYRQRHSPALTFRADAATKTGQQVGRGCPAPRGLALPGRSPWQGRRFARPLHPTRAGGLSRPPCTPTTKGPCPLEPASGFRARHHDEEPDPVPRPSPNPARIGCAVRAFRGPDTPRPAPFRAGPEIRRALLPRYLQRQAFAPDTTTKGVPPLDTRPSVRRLDWRQRAPLDPPGAERCRDDRDARLRIIGGNTGRRAGGDLSARSAAAHEEGHERQREPAAQHRHSCARSRRPMPSASRQKRRRQARALPVIS